MSITPNANEFYPAEEPHQEPAVPAAAASSERKARTLGWLVAILFVVALSEGAYAWWLTSHMRQSERTLVARLGSQQDSIDRLNTQLGERFTVIEDEISSTKGALGSTQGEIRRARQLTAQLEKKQQESANVLSTELGKLQEDQVAARGSIGSITNDVTGVKQEVSATKTELATAKSQLQRVVGDLGVQSDLIARNHTELGELRARGDRDYYEFDLRKANKAQRVGDMGLQLKKVDVKRQKYTISLVADDRNIEKKDKTVFEPVQFYQAGARQATEIVVNQIYKDRIVGYISSPKKREPRVSSLQPEPQKPAAASQTGS